MSYSIETEIGRGGMGCVYKAYSPMGELVALKMMSNKVSCYSEYRELFNAEVNALKRLKHPSVVKIIGDSFSDTAGNYYLPMEFVEGQNLESYIHRNGPMTEAQAREIMIKILDAFIYIHAQNCIHRDIKPSNIMLRENGSICVIDFGIAKDAKTRTGKTVGRIIGTDGYMSPEQASATTIDHRTDIYSLGCLLHFLVTGKHAIIRQSNDVDTVSTIIRGQFPKAQNMVNGISDDFQDVILKASDKNMLKRFQTASEFKTALDPTSTSYKSNQISVGRSNDNDIVIPESYDDVSRKHLIIEYTPEGFTFKDISSFGTTIDGIKIHKETKTIPDFPSYPFNPKVVLAGSYILNWDEVKKKLIILNPPPPPEPGSDEDIGIGWCILAFIIPLVGWIMWAIWKPATPKRARDISIVAWVGFIVNLIINLITLM
ncbi:MAG: protein kinase [Muribaculaceae bacterium]|nr:protein kinase [Muribaculaceae bacterium]